MTEVMTEAIICKSKFTIISLVKAYLNYKNDYISEI